MENQNLQTMPETPDVLAEQLQRVADRRLWLELISGALGILLLAGSIGLFAALILGSMNSPPVILLWTIAVMLWIGFIYLTYRQLFPAFRMIDLYKAASLVEQREPEHEERIISAVDFSENPPDDRYVSRQMVDKVIRIACIEAENINAARILSIKSVLIRGAFCVPVLVLWIIFGSTAPQTIALGLQRIFTPGQGYVAEQPIAFIVQPGDAVVGQGNLFEITASDTATGPKAGTASSDNNFSVELQYVSGGGRELAMSPTSPTSRRLDVPDVESGFRYRVSSTEESSPWYTVQMIPRPQIATVELHYKYPAYTGLPDRVTTGPDWKIQALTGTEVRIVIQTNQPLSDLSRLSVAASDSTPEIDQPLQLVDDLKYQAVINVLASTTYQIRLVNPQGVANASDHPWPIIAVPDQPPMIAITSPQKNIKVRPDDVVPVLYTAGDDFGLTHVQAVVSVDQSSGHIYEIRLPEENTTGFSSQWNLSVPDQMMLADQPSATRIDYYLQATDNRQPAPQTSHTDVYELIIDSHLPYGYQQQQDKARAEEFSQAIHQAIKNLQQVQRHIDSLRSLPPNQALSDEQLQNTQLMADLTAQTARDLTSAAQNNQNSSLSSAAAQAQKIAEESVAPAADKIAAAALGDAQSPQQRSSDLNSSANALSSATTQLQQLAQNLAAQSNREQIADNVSKLSQEQQQVAQEIADNPDSSDALNKQGQLARNVQNLIKQNTILQTPAAAKVQPQIDALKKQTSEIISEQSAVNTQLNGNYQSNKLAQQQALLNQDIQQFNQSSAAVDPNAPHTAPSNDAMNATVADLVDAQYSAANDGQNNIAQNLTNVHHQLDRLARVSAQQQQDQQTIQQQNAATAQQMQQISDDVSAASQKLQNPADNQSLTQGFAQTQKAATELKTAAEQLSNHRLTPQEQNELTQAVDQAGQAADAADWKNAQQAQQALQQSQSDLQQVQSLMNAASQPQLAPADQLNQLSQQASDLAARQNQLAQQTAQLAQQAQNAGQVTPNTPGELPGQIASAANQAGQIAQQVQNTSPDLAQNLSNAQQQMNEAQEAQAQAGSSRPGSADAEQNQLEAMEHMQAAQKALNSAENSPEMQNIPQLNNAQANADNQQNQSGSENQQEQNEQPEQGAQGSDQNGQGQQGQTGQQSAQNGQAAENSGQNSGSPQSGQMAQGGQQGQSGQGQQGQAGQESQNSGQSSAENGQSQSSGSGGQMGGSASAQGNGGQAAAQQYVMSAAQQIQNALQLQQQAANGNAAAAQQAAEALSGAANNLAQAQAAGANLQSTGSSGGGSGNPGASGGMAMGSTGSSGTQGSPSANPGGHGGGGISGNQKAPSSMPPATVAQMGISPAQWRNLGPLEQQQLVNTAGQNLPPGYEEMVRDYYIRLAEMNSND